MVIINRAQDIHTIVDAFSGSQLYLVGGYVRDSLLGTESHDIDFATNRLPHQIIELARLWNLKYWYTDNSIAHGTVTVEGYEITTFRKDVTCDGRNAKVKFADTIEDDLSRRDFTINAMAVNVYTNELIDPFNGLYDLDKCVITTVGNPRQRLDEDKLRALRAIRLANQLGFNINGNLYVEITKTDISSLSTERVREEFLKILKIGSFRYLYSIYALPTYMLYKIIPEFEVLKHLDGGEKHNEYVDLHCWDTATCLSLVSDNPILIFAGLLHDIGKGYTSNEERRFKGHEIVGAEKAKEIMQRMKFSNNDIDFVCTLIRDHMRWHFYDDKITKKGIRRAIKALGIEIIDDMLKLIWADHVSNMKNDYVDYDTYLIQRNLVESISECFVENVPYKLSELVIDGNDLIKEGYNPGKIFSTILNDCLDKVVNGDIENDKDVLLKYVEKEYKHTWTK